MLLRLVSRPTRTVPAMTLVALLGFSAAPVLAQDCDRACLSDLITQYTEALLAHDPTMLPLADEVKFTEDSKALELGEGLWQTVTAQQDFRQDYLDTEKQIAASHIAFYEGDTHVLLSVLLHVEDSEIAGIETLVQRVTPESRFQPTELGAPIRGMNDPVPGDGKQSRESMIATALTYTEGLRIGSFTDAGTPFAEQTYRVENGWIAADVGGMYSQYITLHPSIIASVAAVDEENGIVLLWMNFGHAGNSYGEGNSLVTFEAFKVWGDEIHSINAFFRALPISTARFWPSSDPIPK